MRIEIASKMYNKFIYLIIFFYLFIYFLLAGSFELSLVQLSCDLQLANKSLETRYVFIYRARQNLVVQVVISITTWKK